MPSKREQVLSALFDRLRSVGGATVRRNVALPQTVPPGGLVILRDGEPGEPDVTLNPRSEFYGHRAEIEAYVAQPVTGGGEAELDRLLIAISSVLAPETVLGGLAENLVCSAPVVEAVAVEGAAPILSARLHPPRRRHQRQRRLCAAQLRYRRGGVRQSDLAQCR